MTTIDEHEKTRRWIVTSLTVVAILFMGTVGGCEYNSNRDKVMADTKRIEACIQTKGVPTRVIVLDNRNVSSVAYVCNLTNPNFP